MTPSIRPEASSTTVLPLRRKDAKSQRLHQGWHAISTASKRFTIDDLRLTIAAWRLTPTRKWLDLFKAYSGQTCESHSNGCDLERRAFQFLSILVSPPELSLRFLRRGAYRSAQDSRREYSGEPAEAQCGGCGKLCAQLPVGRRSQHRNLYLRLPAPTLSLRGVSPRRSYRT